MNDKQEYELIQDDLKNNKFVSTPKNNKLIFDFLEAKRSGGFERIIFKTKCGYKTLVKKARNLTKVDQHFKKDFDKITEKELLAYRDLLNDDKIFCDKTLIKWNEQKTKSWFEIVPTNRPLSYRTKEDYKQNFTEFYHFIMEWAYQKTGAEIKDITRYFTLVRPSDYKDIKVDFIPDDDLMTLLNNIRNPHFKALVQLSIMSGARPCEIINLRIGKGFNLYKNKENKWIVHLPKIKRISYKKFPFELDMYEDELYPYFNNLKKKEGELVFKMTEGTFRKLMLHYTEKYLGKRYSPKILRKTARMIRTNAGYSHDWINKLMGHAPESRVQGHYLNYEGVKNEPIANEKLKAQQYPSLKKDYEALKLQLQAQKEQMAQLISNSVTKEELLAELARRGGK